MTLSVYKKVYSQYIYIHKLSWTLIVSKIFFIQIQCRVGWIAKCTAGTQSAISGTWYRRSGGPTGRCTPPRAPTIPAADRHRAPSTRPSSAMRASSATRLVSSYTLYWLVTTFPGCPFLCYMLIKLEISYIDLEELLRF